MTSRPRVLVRAAVRGAVAGMVGVAAMTAAEKVEQAVSRRPDSYVPGRALLTLLGRHPTDRDRPFVANQALHWSTGAILGVLRGVWAAVGIRGPWANVAHTVARLSFDQTLENTTGVGAPPASWPVREQVADFTHKGLYATVTGVVADRWIAPVLESRRGTVSH